MRLFLFYSVESTWTLFLTKRVQYLLGFFPFAPDGFLASLYHIYDHNDPNIAIRINLQLGLGGSQNQGAEKLRADGWLLAITGCVYHTNS